MSDSPTFLSVADVAERWAVSPRTVRRRIDAGELAAARLAPHAIRVRLDVVEAYETRALEASAA